MFISSTINQTLKITILDMVLHELIMLEVNRAPAHRAGGMLLVLNVVLQPMRTTSRDPEKLVVYHSRHSWIRRNKLVFIHSRFPLQFIQ